MQLRTVYTAINPADADVVGSRLDSAGFHPVISQGLTTGFALGAGGVLVQVPEPEAEDAADFLADPGEAPPA